MAYKVLVVDDETPVLGPIERCLRLKGFEVSTAANSKDALALCEKQTFDLLVLDFIMPGVDGLELLARIRKLSPLARAIIVSGQLDRAYKEQDIAQRLRETVEADGYLNKPVSCDALVQLSNALLDEDVHASWRQTASRVVAGKEGSIVKAKTAAKELKKAKK